MFVPKKEYNEMRDAIVLYIEEAAKLAAIHADKIVRLEKRVKELESHK